MSVESSIFIKHVAHEACRSTSVNGDALLMREARVISSENSMHKLQDKLSFTVEWNCPVKLNHLTTQ